MSKWTPPKVYQGDIVLWHDAHNRTENPYTALVTAIAKEGMVDLWVCPVSAHNGFPKSTVRYADDPNRRAIESATDGVWTYTERTLLEAVPPAAPPPSKK